MTPTLKPAAAVTAALWTSAVMAATPDGPAATTVAYQVDASLVQIDEFARPAAILPAPASRPAAAQRAPGLGRFRLGLDLHAGGNGALTLVLRPDAVNRVTETGSQPSRDLDTRAGETYRPAPSLRLLDAYQLHWRLGGSLDIAAGVWEELGPTLTSYPEVLAFGLTAELPAKFSGGRARWQTGRGFGIDLYVFQGDEDRAEAMSRDHHVDQAPVARDPHQAAALAAAWQPGTGLSLGLTVGFGDSAELGGRRSEQFGQLTGKWTTSLGTRALTAALDARQAGEQWRLDSQKVAPRLQQSVSLTTAVAVVPGHWALVGARFGRAQHAKDEQTLDTVRTFQGWQLEAGYETELDQGLTLSLLLDQEHRRLTTPGVGETGGFVDGAADRSTIRRLGLQLDYILGGNA